MWNLYVFPIVQIHAFWSAEYSKLAINVLIHILRAMKGCHSAHGVHHLTPSVSEDWLQPPATLNRISWYLNSVVEKNAFIVIYMVWTDNKFVDQHFGRFVKNLGLQPNCTTAANLCSAIYRFVSTENDVQVCKSNIVVM